MSNEEIKDMLYIDKDLDSFSDDKEMNEKIKNFDFRKLYGLPEGDIDVLLEQFREEGFSKYCRKGNWRYSWTKVLNNDGTIFNYPTRIANFRYINKWNQETETSEYKIIIDHENNYKILWIGVDMGYHFLSVDKKIYGFSYGYKSISLFPNISVDEYFNDDNMETNDKFIYKYSNNTGRLAGGRTIVEAKDILSEEKIGVIISIDEYFDKRFFYRGPKWNKYYNFMYCKDMMILISIQPKDNFFYIEIENISYPHYGYILLDLNEIRIVEAKKIEN